tara:strand:+ start:1503 stop:1898 length:396 start_codon:yes stop_codon:yes gene_type:complete
MSKQFTHNVKVYYEDTDAGGVVYYSNYLKYLERARTEAVNSIGLSNKKLLEKNGVLIIVKSCKINYIKPAQLEDHLEINSKVKSTTKTSFTMSQVIKNKKKIITEAEVHLVVVNKKGKPTMIPNALSQLLK